MEDLSKKKFIENYFEIEKMVGYLEFFCNGFSLDLIFCWLRRLKGCDRWRVMVEKVWIENEIL